MSLNHSVVHFSPKYPFILIVFPISSLSHRQISASQIFHGVNFSHQDFTTEQYNVTPANGWKAYYAITREILNINQRFFDIIRERSLLDTRRLWLVADYVKCFHASGEVHTGYIGVIRSWEQALEWEPVFNFQVRDVRSRVLPGVAWLTMKAISVLEDHPILNMTNVYEFHSGQWFMVHHHSSVMRAEGQVANQPALPG